MDQAKDAEIEGGADERAQERMVEMMKGDFRTWDLVSRHSAFSGTEVLCTVIHLCSVNQD
jgi:hypothetical protein